MRNYKHQSINKIIDDLGSRLRNLRLQHNVKQQDLVDHIGISLTSLKNMEKGKDVSLSTFLKCLRYFDALGQLENILPENLGSPKDIVLNKKSEKKRAR